MMPSRRQKIEDALTARYPTVPHATISLMSAALIIAETEGITTFGAWVRTKTFKDQGIPKSVLDDLAENKLLFERMEPKGKIFVWERTGKAIYEPTLKEGAFRYEIQELLKHAHADAAVKQIIADILVIPLNSDDKHIFDTFIHETWTERLRLYNKVLREIDAQGLSNPKFIHKTVSYWNKNHRYRLSPSGRAFLSKNG